MFRARGGLHEELSGTCVQDRVPDADEILQKSKDRRLSEPLVKCLIAALAFGIAGSIALDADLVAAEGVRKLSGAQIRAKLAGMQITDEVHYRIVFDRDGTLRNYSMGIKKAGKWTVEKDELCLYLQDPEDGCYEVSLSGNTVEMKPTGLGGSVDGIVQPPTDR
jgi:hypothetical protein